MMVLLQTAPKDHPQVGRKRRPQSLSLQRHSAGVPLAMSRYDDARDLVREWGMLVVWGERIK